MHDSVDGREGEERRGLFGRERERERERREMKEGEVGCVEVVEFCERRGMKRGWRFLEQSPANSKARINLGCFSAIVWLRSSRLKLKHIEQEEVERRL